MSSLNSQTEIQKLRNANFLKFRQAKESHSLGRPMVTAYGSLAIKEVYEKFSTYRIPHYHEEYEPNPSHYQYDLELHIFFNFDQLLLREKELNPKLIKILDRAKEEGDNKVYGAALLTREEHLLNAMAIRWPEKVLPTGQVSGTIVRTPWIEDFFYGISNYEDTVMFGGAGQGKTFGPLAFMTMTYDHFIKTKSGAGCSFSTVSASKMDNSSWSLLNKLQSYKAPYKFSLYAGQAVKAPDYTYKRVNEKGKYIEEGGLLRGVLLASGRKDSKSIDKLTGSHDPKVKIYLLDEMQSTDTAPLDAYTNIFLHPQHKWFIGSGNYEKDGDLLSVNAEPNTGWESVNAATHMWEGTLKSLTQDLGKTSLVIHYNNDLSPAMKDPAIAHKYGRFMPTPKKKESLYKNKEQLESYGYKRFWIGFRFEKETSTDEKVLTYELLKESKACDDIDFTPLVNIGSFDSAAASVDGNTFTTCCLGLDRDGYPMLAPISINVFDKPHNSLEYYSRTCDNIIEEMKRNNIASNNLIMDWTQRIALIELLAQKGITCHHLIYNQKCPEKDGLNEITKTAESPILLTVTKTLQGMFEKQTSIWAHEFIGDRISLGAYVFRWFIETGRVRNLNNSLIDGKGCFRSFEKEFLMRTFRKNTKRYKNPNIVTLDSKDDFKIKFKFSPDALDTLFQACYMLFVIFRIRPDKKGLGLLKPIDPNKKNKSDVSKLWYEARNKKF